MPAWATWGQAPFLRADALVCPVLLYLGARWSPACDALESGVLSQAAVRAAIADSCVPVKVDVDEQPDLAERYGLGAWPSLLLLSPDGDVLSGGTWAEPGRLIDLLAQVHAQWRERRADLREAAARQEPPWPQPAGPACPPDPDAPDTFLAWALSLDDVAAGGATGCPVQPHAAALQGVLRAGLRAGRQDAAQVVERALLRLADSALVDRDDGGVFRAAAGPRWTRPEPVKLLAMNAALLDTFLEAGTRLADQELLRSGQRIAHFLTETLGEAGGGFAHAWRAPHPAGAMPSTPDGWDRRSRAGAWIDPRRFVDGTAAAASALLRAARRFQDPALAERAVHAIERVVLPAYERGAGVAHLLAPIPGVRGLLADQAASSEALLDAFEATTMRVYLDLAEELMRTALRRCWQPAAGAFQDRPLEPQAGGAIGLARQPLFPLEANCRAARVLARLAALCDDGVLAERADDILGAFAATWRAFGADGAHYVLAWLDVSRADQGT